MKHMTPAIKDSLLWKQKTISTYESSFRFPLVAKFVVMSHNDPLLFYSSISPAILATFFRCKHRPPSLWRNCHVINLLADFRTSCALEINFCHPMMEFRRDSFCFCFYTWLCSDVATARYSTKTKSKLD